MATYVNNLRLTELATGEGSGTWGTTTNTSLELIGEALGFNTQNCFSSDADATTTVADGASDPARSFYFKVTSSATLSATRTLTIAPNTLSRVMFIENATTGSQSIAISQGSGANVTIATGKTAVVYLDGAGSGAAVVDAMAGVDPGVTDTLAEVLVAGNATGGTDIVASTDDKVQFRDSAIYINSSADGQLDIVADTEIQIATTTVDLNGNLDVSGTALVTGVLTTTAATVFNGGFASNADSTLGTDKKVQFRDSAIYINSSADGQLDIVADTEIQIAATTIDINGAINASGEIIAASLDISGDIDVDGTTNLDVVDIDGAVDMASTLAVGGVVTANAGVVVDNITIDGTEIDLSSGDLTIDVAGDIILDADGSTISMKDGGTTRFTFNLDATPDLEFTAVQSNYRIYVPDAPANVFNTGDRGNITIQASNSTSGNQAMSGGRVFINAGNSHNGQTGDIVLSTGANLLSGSDNGIIRFNIGGTASGDEAIRIDASGNLLVNGTNATAKLVVDGAANTYTSRFNSSTTTGQAFGTRIRAGTNSSDFALLVENTSAATMLAVRGDGNVGIGTSSPSSGLSGSNTNLTISDADGSDIKLTRDTGQSLVVGVTSSNDGYIWGSSLTSLSFRATTSEAMRIDSAGKILIGDSASHTADLLQIETPASGGGHGIQIRRNDSNTDQSVGSITFGNNTATDLASISAKTDGATDNCALLFNTSATGGSNTERMRIDSSGNLGLGTSSPSTYDSRANNLVVGDSGDAGVTIFSGSTSNARLQFAPSGATGLDNGLIDYDNNNDSMSFATGGSERMRIDSSGNVGIGTSSPTSYSGQTNLNINSSGVSRIDFDIHDSLQGMLVAESGYMSLLANTGNYLMLGSNNTERMRIDASGNVGIGEDTPAQKLHLRTSGVNTGARLQVAGGSGRSYDILSTTDGSLTITDANASSERMRIDSSGLLQIGTTGKTGRINLQPNPSNNHFVEFYTTADGKVGEINTTGGTTTNYVTSSDQRLKENIVNAPSASDDIDAIQVRSFDWKADGSHQKYGMVAQELQSVAPEAVSGDADSEDMMGVDYSKLVPMLVKEIQSLRARVAQLETN